MPPNHVWVNSARLKIIPVCMLTLAMTLFFYIPAPKSKFCSKLLLIHLLLCAIILVPGTLKSAFDLEYSRVFVLSRIRMEELVQLGNSAF